MTDIQAMMDAFIKAQTDTRAQYQLTIGKAIDLLTAMDAQKPIKYTDGKAPREAMSYRGYYSDLAFDDQDAATVGDVLANLEFVLNTELTGYKGGEFMMHENVPIWRSQYGEASGVAWMDVSDFGDFAAIITKEIE